MNDREIAVMLKVDTPFCVKLYEVFETEDQVQLILELLKGNDLFSRIVDRQQTKFLPFTEEETGIIMKRPSHVLCIDSLDSPL